MQQITVYGAPWCPDCHRSKTFLADQRVPFRWVDIDADADGRAFVEQLQGGGRTIPTIIFEDGTHLLEPSNAELAAKLGMVIRASRSAYDLLVLGGGPAGLSAAIYAAREGLDALVLERGALGGQAGATEQIDNYPGFPEGIRGQELADRLIAHARRYGVELVSGAEVAGIRHDTTTDRLEVATTAGDRYTAPVALVATGSRYRRLGLDGEEGLTGLGVHYCATCDGPFYRGAGEIVVVGGGNSALEEAVFLASLADHVTILVRTEIRASEVVAEKVRRHPRITVWTGVEPVALEAPAGRLAAVLVRNRETGATARIETPAAFVFVGLDPNTAFLRGTVDLDAAGFVRTDDRYRTSLDGLFAAGDVRAGSAKQVGSAAGEGIAALLAIRHHLADRHERPVARVDEG